MKKGIQNFFVHGRLLRSINHTFIALVPKNLKSHGVEYFILMSLCIVAYKVITKIIAS